MSAQRDLFIPALKGAEGRGNYRRDVLELMLERAMDYASANRVRLTDAFHALEVAHGGFGRLYLAAQRWHTLQTAHLVAERVGEIDTSLQVLAEIEMEPVPYRLANASGEARDLMLELARSVEQLREFRATLSSYPDMVRQVDDVIDKAEHSRYFETAANIVTAQDYQRPRARG